MYHSLVRRRVLALFESVNRGEAGPVLDSFADTFEHVFLGTSALGGSRSTRQSTMAWYDRLYRLLPDIHFDVESVQVAGWPANTLVVAHWRERNSGTDGIITHNGGVHILHLRWGRVTRLIICPDTVALQSTLDRLAQGGVHEAHSLMIQD